MPTELIKHPYVLAAIGISGVLVLGSVWYYVAASTPPSVNFSAGGQSATSTDVSGDGVVSAAENPDLSFVAGGKVTYVPVAVGDTVYKGQLLASLDTGVLAANLAGAQARLQALQSGATPSDIQIAQTSYAQASQQEDALYAALPAQLYDAFSKADNAIYVTLNPLFGSESAQGQTLAFSTNNYDEGISLGREYNTMQDNLSAWRTANAGLDTTSHGALASALTGDLAYLQSLRNFLSDLGQALSNDSAATFTSSNGLTLADAHADVQTASVAVDAQIASLTATQSSLEHAKLGVTSAQDQLQKTLSGTRSEDIAAQRVVVDAAAAQLTQSEIIAPFGGTVASVRVKPGDVIAPNSVGISLQPSGALEVSVFVSEVEVTRVKVGDPAGITLDAYGTGRVFSGTVIAKEDAPSPTGTGTAMGYKVTVAFAEADPAVALGMHANVTIHPAAQ